MNITALRSFLVVSAAAATFAGGLAPASGQVHEAPKHDCGTGMGGLSLAAHSARDLTTACDIAHEVSDAVANSGRQVDDEDDAVTVEARGVAWQCVQRQTKNRDNAYTQCVNGPEKVTLGV